RRSWRSAAIKPPSSPGPSMKSPSGWTILLLKCEKRRSEIFMRWIRIERRRIGSALADSGLLYEAIDDLMAENHGNCYSAFSLLFLVAKAGVVEPLSSVIEKHPSLDLSLAVIRLLAASGEPEVAPTLKRLASNTALAPELRSAAAESMSRF